MKKLSEVYKELGIAFTFPIKIENEASKVTYFEESSDGYWHKYEYDSEGNETYHETSNGYWRKCEYNSEGNETYHEESNGYWCKREYDSEGNETYFENSGRYRKGTPRSAETCEGKVVEVDGVKYEMKTINN
jgi:hypothetical protein